MARLVTILLFVGTLSCIVFLFVTSRRDLKEIEFQNHQLQQKADKAVHDRNIMRQDTDWMLEIQPLTVSEYSRVIECQDFMYNVSLGSEFYVVPFEEALRDQAYENWHDRWVSHGEIPASSENIAHPKFDVVYSWINASDPEFFALKNHFAEHSPINIHSNGVWNHEAGNRHRDWDELRYSIRSIETYLQDVGTIQIISTYRQKPDPQRPSWLAGSKFTHLDYGPYKIQVIGQEDLWDADESICLPSFSSASVEAQYRHLKGDNDAFLAMNDDFFLGRQHSAADVFTPLFGRPFSERSEADYLVYNTMRRPNFTLEAWVKGEWPYISLSSYLLNQRFGSRPRAYPKHNGHPMSHSIIQELADTFPTFFKYSALHKFRGENESIHLWYLYNHFTIERHRESLLWSYIKFRSDMDSNGIIDASEQQQMLAHLSVASSQWDRLSLKHFQNDLRNSGLPVPYNQIPYWTSMDGPYFVFGVSDTNTGKFEGFNEVKYPSEIKTCDLDILECFGPNFGEDNYFITSDELFKILSFEKPQCGDCIINRLVRRSGSKGLDAFLPDTSHTTQNRVLLSKKNNERQLAIKAIMRYSYFMTNFDGWFVELNGPEIGDRIFPDILAHHPPQFCINDNINYNPEAVKKAKIVFKDFLEEFFPEKSTYET